METLIVSFVSRTLIATVPLLLGTVGEIITERSGVLNLGVEGMMALGACAAFIAAGSSGSLLLGAFAGIAAGALLAAVHAAVSVSFRANQTVSGLAVTMAGTGLAGVIGKPFIGKSLAEKASGVHFPVLSDIPLLGGVLKTLDPFFYVSIILTVLVWLYLARTKGGIIVRTAGENPRAAESFGIDVYGVRYACTIAGGAFSGLAGAFLALSYSNSWIEGMTAGRGWIVIGLTIFALWNPVRAVAGSLLFGGIFVAQYLIQPLGIPSNVLGMLPYLATLVVLVFEGARSDKRTLSEPAALGEAFKRRDR